NSAPTRRIRSPCCARAASGHATAAPPSSVMNSRRLMQNIGVSNRLAPPSVGLPHAHPASRAEARSLGQTLIVLNRGAGGRFLTRPLASEIAHQGLGCMATRSGLAARAPFAEW